MRLPRPRASWTVLFSAVLSFATVTDSAHAQFGVYLPGAGATNRSMAGASTAAPLSAAGALYWNPATISGLSRSELEAGAEMLFVNTSVASRFDAGVLGPGVPPVALSGRTDSDTGVTALPTIGLAYLPEDSRLSFGLGVFAVAGFGVDYPGSSTNPALMPPPPTGVGFGPVFSDFQVLQIHPAFAMKLTDRLSIGMGPTLNLAKLRIDPFIVAAPDNANGDAFATFPPGTHEETTWGAGFAVGAYYRADCWAVGASFRSPQWFDKFRINSTDELGRERKLSYTLDLPLIFSVGGAYTGIERWLFAADVRYVDYANANGFGEGGFSPDGAVRGPGWKSIFALALGAQYQLRDNLALRAGYNWNESPVPASQSFINTVSIVIAQHNLTAGLSWDVTPDFSLTCAYVHGFENDIEGPLVTPAGAVPGTSFRNTASLDSVVIGAQVKFGCARRSACHSDVAPE